MSNKTIKWTIFTVTVIGNFIAMLDSTSVTLALYPIANDLGVTMSQVQWVIIAYMLTLTIFLPFFGKLGDIFAKNKLYSIGFILFAIGAILNSASYSFESLVAFRCVEALGASIMLSNASAIIATIFRDEKRGKALGINGSVIAIGGMSGPAIGGLLINNFGWRSIFIPSIPIALIGAYYAYKLLPSSANKLKDFKFDYLGFFYFTVCLLALLLAISEGHVWGWKSIQIITLSIISLLFGALFYFRDYKINYPLINFKMFKIREFTLGNLAVMTSYMAMFTNGILLPFFLQEILKYDALKAGLLILPYSVTLSITAPLSGNYAGKHGSRFITLCGPTVMIIALLIFTTFDQSTPAWQIIVASGIMGIGNGLFQSPSNNAIIASVQKNELGIASGILALSRNMGHIMGVALTITLFESFRTVFLKSMEYTQAFLKAYHSTMIIGMCFAVICFILAFFAYKNSYKFTKS